MDQQEQQADRDKLVQQVVSVKLEALDALVRLEVLVLQAEMAGLGLLVLQADLVRLGVLVLQAVLVRQGVLVLQAEMVRLEHQVDKVKLVLRELLEQLGQLV
jgi:hypothetical protein